MKPKTVLFSNIRYAFCLVPLATAYREGSINLPQS